MSGRASKRRLQRRILRAHFGFDAERNRWLDPSRAPTTPTRLAHFRARLAAFLTWRQAWINGITNIAQVMQLVDAEPTLPRDTVTRLALAAILRGMKDAHPRLASRLLEVPPPPCLAELKEGALFCLTGTVAAEISLTRNLRLRMALAESVDHEDAGPLRWRLYERLPTEVQLHHDPGADLAALRKHVVAAIEAEAANDRPRQADLRRWAEKEAALLERNAKLADLATLMDLADLSGQERRVMELGRE